MEQFACLCADNSDFFLFPKINNMDLLYWKQVIKDTLLSFQYSVVCC